MKWLQHHQWLWLALFVAVGLVPYLLLLSAPFSFLLTNILPDDAFYYFQIARNIVGGLGSTFDGVNLTNGYHPLWMLLIIPIWEFFSTGTLYDVAPIRGTLALSVFLIAMTSIVLAHIAFRYTKNIFIIGGALLMWLWNPFNLYEGMSGLETPLALFFLSLLLLAAIRMKEHPTNYRAGVAGLCAGLLMLSRLDMVFYFLAFLTWLLYAYKRKGITYGFVAGIVATMVVAPFLYWNTSTFNMAFTSASVTSTMVNRHLIVQDNGAGPLVYPKAAIYTLVRGIRDVIEQTGAPIAFLVFVGAAGGWVWFGGGRSLVRQWARSMPVEWWLFGGFVLHFLVSTMLRFTYRSWYFIAFNIFLVLLLMWLLSKWHEARALRTKAVVFAVVLCVGMYAISWQLHLEGREIAQENMYQAAQWMNEHVSKGAVVGVFNAGVQGYFSTHRVINLDGLVNNTASDAMADKTLWNYAVHVEEVTHISDFPLYLTYRYKGFLGVDDPFVGMTLIHTINSAGEHTRGGAIEIYKIGATQ